MRFTYTLYISFCPMHTISLLTATSKLQFEDQVMAERFSTYSSWLFLITAQLNIHYLHSSSFLFSLILHFASSYGNLMKYLRKISNMALYDPKETASSTENFTKTQPEPILLTSAKFCKRNLVFVRLVYTTQQSRKNSTKM